MDRSKIIEIRGLTKTYGHLRALDDVSFTIERGRIYGFIGENGAGKTTCIRVLAGLTKPDSGDVYAFGQKFPEGALAARNKMGFMVERPIYHAALTAAQNLDLQMQLYGCKNQGQIPGLLERVGLKDTGKRKLKDFSLGMKQRLGIAMALANSPQLLVLDEPVNGLDPVGMVDVRNILKRLNEEGITIFLSNHILSELYQLATDYLIIHRGRIIQQITLDALNRACRKNIRVTADQPKVLAEAVLALHPDVHLEKRGDDSLVIFGDQMTTADVGALALKEQVTLSNLSLEGDDLEAFYIKAISGGGHA